MVLKMSMVSSQFKDLGAFFQPLKTGRVFAAYNDTIKFLLGYSTRLFLASEYIAQWIAVCVRCSEIAGEGMITDIRPINWVMMNARK
jgi:hypothetical protein